MIKWVFFFFFFLAKHVQRFVVTKRIPFRPLCLDAPRTNNTMKCVDSTKSELNGDLSFLFINKVSRVHLMSNFL